jgi:putative DNA primase/helicase
MRTLAYDTAKDKENMLHAALAYARRGWPVFPCQPRNKKPLTEHGLLDATTDEAIIRAWWERCPTANVAIATGERSGFIVIDIDRRKGGHLTVEALEHELPETVESLTSDGKHLLYASPGVKVRNDNAGKLLGAGVDLKGDGGYILAPPSIHPDGPTYEFEATHGPDDIEIAPLPAWILEKLRAHAQPKTRAQSKGTPVDLAQLTEALYTIPASVPYDTWVRVGMALHHWNPEDVGSQLWVEWSRTCPEKFDPEVCQRKWDSFTSDRDQAVTLATLFHLAKEHGWQEQKKRNPMNNGVAANHGTEDRTPTVLTTPAGFDLTDADNARRLVHRHGEDLRYCYAWHRWLVWDGTRWTLDDTGEVERRAKKTARAIATQEAAQVEHTDDKLFKSLLAWSRHSLSKDKLSNMIALAQSEEGVAVLPDHLDKDLWLLNVSNGTLALRSCTLRPHDKADLITKLAPVDFDPHAACPIFLAFLEKITDGKKPLQEFLQRAVGRCLTGDTSEKILHVMHGTGDNGKTTLLETIHLLFGDDYAVRTPTETLLVKKFDGIPNDVAKLKGARFVYASEAEQGRRLAESMIKDLTGGDTIAARFMRGEWFNFKPEFKLWLGTNHKPVIRGTDKAIWNRVKLIPFTVVIPETEQDKHLTEKFKGELSGILNWALEGLYRWQHEGLHVPEEVKAATEAYRKEMDKFADFLEECCKVHPDLTTPASDLFAAYLSWAEQNKERTLSRNEFADRLKERGLDNSTRNSVTGRKQWRGIGLRITES